MLSNMNAQLVPEVLYRLFGAATFYIDSFIVVD